MAPRKGGGGGKKKGGKKRKNVWDDAVAEDAAAGASKPRKLSKGSSMFGQWKQRKQAQRTKERQFYGSVEEKKAWQREHLERTRERTANAIYEDAARGKRSPVAERTVVPGATDSDDSSGSSSSDSDDELPTGKNSLFAQFVRTFQPPEEDEEEEEEYEEVLVDANGQEIVEDDAELDGNAALEHEEEPVAEQKAEQLEEEEEDDADEQPEDEAEQEQEDPYRRRYLLSAFSEQDAKAFDALPRKFEAVTLPNEVATREFDVAYRRGVADAEGLAVAPEDAITQTPVVRARLQQTWKHRGLDADTQFPEGSVEQALFRQLSSYSDVLFAGQTYENTESLRRMSAMHVLNHVLKARDTVIRNNERIRRREKATQEERAALGEDEDEEKEYRDQGLCRASVLVLLPLRSAALAFVKLLLELLPANVSTFHNKERFLSEYGSAADEDEEQEQEPDEGLKEWQRVFAQGNNDDCFQTGLSLSRKGLRFYSDYHHADIIIASPLGLRQQLGDEAVALEEADGDGDAPKLSSDFLSSIEVCVVDSASLVAMQNLEHLRTVLRAANAPPKEAPHADFARVREWQLAFLGAYFRQTVVFAHGLEPALNALVGRTCRNVAGLVRWVRRYDAADGSASISRVVPRVQQVFQRVDVGHGGRLTAQDEAELRFQYFRQHVFEPLLDHPRKHVLIFIPSYLDYVRVRNLFGDSMNKKLIRSLQCCEYTPSNQVSRARTSFFHGRCHVLLVTERFHFYHQYHLRGVQQLIWYGLPVMGDFYAEMLNMLPGEAAGAMNGQDDGLDGTDGQSSIALFTRLDLLRMQRIVGNRRAERMCRPKAPKPTFLFC